MHYIEKVQHWYAVITRRSLSTHLQSPPFLLACVSDTSPPVFVCINPSTQTCSLLFREALRAYLVSESLRLHTQMPEVAREIAFLGHDADRALRDILSALQVDRATHVEHPEAFGFRSTRGLFFHRAQFDPQPGETPFFDSILARMTNADGFLAFLGSLFTPSSAKEQYLYLWGEGGTGKTTLVEWLAWVLNGSYFTTPQPRVDDRFFTAALVGKRLCHISEASPRFQVTDFFKSLSGDEWMRVEYKGRDSTNVKMSTRFIFTSNHMIELDDRIENVRRAIVCRLNPSLDFRSKEEVMTTLMREAPAIAHKCLESYNAANRGGFVLVESNKRELDIVIAARNRNYEEIVDEIFQFTGKSYDYINKVDLLKIYRYFGINDNRERARFKVYMHDRGARFVQRKVGYAKRNIVCGVKYNEDSLVVLSLGLKSSTLGPMIGGPGVDEPLNLNEGI